MADPAYAETYAPGNATDCGAAIEALLGVYTSPPFADLPPLHGGIMGYLGYDVIREVEHLLVRLELGGTLCGSPQCLPCRGGDILRGRIGGEGIDVVAGDDVLQVEPLAGQGRLVGRPRRVHPIGPGEPVRLSGCLQFSASIAE